MGASNTQLIVISWVPSRRPQLTVNYCDDLLRLRSRWIQVEHLIATRETEQVAGSVGPSDVTRVKRTSVTFRWRVSYHTRTRMIAVYIVIAPLIAFAAGWCLIPSEEENKREPTSGVKDAIELPHIRIEQDALRQAADSFSRNRSRTDDQSPREPASAHPGRGEIRPPGARRYVSSSAYRKRAPGLYHRGIQSVTDGAEAATGGCRSVAMDAWNRRFGMDH